MADGTAIEWTDATWNPLRGCTRVSEGCRNCYAEVMAARFSGPGQWGEGLATMTRVHHTGKIDHRWTGKVILVEDQLDQPLRWKRPRRIFVNSTSDLFHESVPDEWIDRIFAVMALCPRHTFQVLTKRPERMRSYLADLTECLALADNDGEWFRRGFAVPIDGALAWPLRNVWLGTSVEDQATADARIPHLLNTPAAVRFLSAEPLLGPVDLHSHTCRETGSCSTCPACLGGLDWIIVGGESGPGARPMHPDWARSLRDQCQAAGVAFFFKQWGEWGPGDHLGEEVDGCAFGCFNDAGHWVYPVDQDWASRDRRIMFRLGKKAAGRLLDGREWNQMPGVTP